MDIPTKLQLVFEKALSLEPRNSYADLDAFVSDLYRASDMEQPPAEVKTPRPPSRSGIPVVVSARHVIPWVKWIGGGLAVLLVLGIGLDLWLAAPSGLEEITVHTEPPGASVYVDGVYLGQAPLDRITLSEPGRRLRVVKKRYRSIDRHLTSQDGFVSLVMEFAPYDLKVESEPAGAEIWLDGKHVGTSPAVLKRVPGKGEHSLELRLGGFVPKTVKLDPLRLPREPFQLELEPSSDPR
jgi:hypothetical protein